MAENTHRVSLQERRGREGEREGEREREREGEGESGGREIEREKGTLHKYAKIKKKSTKSYQMLVVSVYAITALQPIALA